jgi:hypothetical protein
MNTQKHEKTIILPKTGGLTVKIIIERQGQEHPSRGDRVSVYGSIEFPGREISERLRFGNRVLVMGTGLDRYWGYRSPEFLRRTREFFSDTWAKAEKAALEHCEMELQKLIDALEVRHQALIDADKEEKEE